MQAATLATIDYVTIGLYLCAILALGLWIGRRMHSGSDYFLAGRTLPWWAIGMSLVATDIGGTDIIGVGGSAYRHGLAVGNFEWIGCVPAMIVAAFVFVPFFWRTGVYTIPEFMERRFNAGVRSALALCWLAFMACNLGIMLYASAKMMHSFIGWDEIVCLLLTALLVGVYTFAGGLAAVVYTDMIQCAVMIGGCLLVLVMGLVELGGIGGLMDGLRELEQHKTAAVADGAGAHTALILPVDTKTPFPWTGIFFGLALILSPAYWIGNQAIVQRTLGARSEFEVKAGFIWGALLKNVVPFVIAVPGLIALVKFPVLADQDKAFPALVSSLLPAGLRGLFLAAFLAALMSSVDSYLNSAATILSNDLYRRFVRPQASDRDLLTVGRTTTVVLVLWGVGFAVWIGQLGETSGIYAIFQTLMAFFQGPALALLLTGVLWRRATGAGALVGFLGGVACSVTLFTLNQQAVYTRLGIEPLFQIADPFLYFSVWAFLVALGLTVLVSFLTPPEPEEKLRHLIYHRARAEGNGE
jgi:SSS family solute:Na+ symporter